VPRSTFDNNNRFRYYDTVVVILPVWSSAILEEMEKKKTSRERLLFGAMEMQFCEKKSLFYKEKTNN